MTWRSSKYPKTYSLVYWSFCESWSGKQFSEFIWVWGLTWFSRWRNVPKIQPSVCWCSCCSWLEGCHLGQCYAYSWAICPVPLFQEHSQTLASIFCFFRSSLYCKMPCITAWGRTTVWRWFGHRAPPVRRTVVRKETHASPIGQLGSSRHTTVALSLTPSCLAWLLPRCASVGHPTTASQPLEQGYCFAPRVGHVRENNDSNG